MNTEERAKEFLRTNNLIEVEQPISTWPIKPLLSTMSEFAQSEIRAFAEKVKDYVSLIDKTANEIMVDNDDHRDGAEFVHSSAIRGLCNDLYNLLKEHDK